MTRLYSYAERVSHRPAAQAYFVETDQLVYVRFTDDRMPTRGVELAGPRSRRVSPATGEKGPWKPSWSRVTVVACYDEHGDLVDVEIIGVPSRRPASELKQSPQSE